MEKLLEETIESIPKGSKIYFEPHYGFIVEKIGEGKFQGFWFDSENNGHDGSFVTYSFGYLLNYKTTVKIEYPKYTKTSLWNKLEGLE